MSNGIFEVLKDLPVAAILDDIVTHTIAGGVAIVTAETSSGKTMLVPAKLQEVTGRHVYVAQPRRILAINAAETLASLTGSKVGEKFGYAVSARGLDPKEPTHGRRQSGLTFSTYGYMLSAGIVSQVENIIIDEAHEPSIDAAIVKALIKRRLKDGTGPKATVVMSATLDAQNELDYWKGYNPRVFTVPNKQRFVCDFRYEPATPIHLAVLDLVEKGHRGILVFVSGVKDISNAAEAIQKEIDFRIALATENLPPIEICGIHGNSDYEERSLALASPTDNTVKVLIGTNVIKTGMNLPWVDAGVSDGLQKETVAIRGTGAMALQQMPISMDDLIQQKGRTNRFRKSTFILIGATAPKDMKSAQESELSRLPLERLYMHCLSYGADPRELDFSTKLDPDSLDTARLILQRFGFIDKKDHVTEDGEIANNLPVGLEAAALLCHANKINNLEVALVVAAVLESGLLRHDRRRSHGFNDSSDLLDAAVAFSMIRDLPSDMTPHAKRNAMKDMNVNVKKYGTAEEILRQLEKLLDIKAYTKAYVKYPMDEDVLDELRQCILASGINHLGSYDPQAIRNKVSMFGSFLTYGADNGTAVHVPWDTTHRRPITANLRVIEVKERRISFTVAEQITVYDFSNLVEFDKVRPGVFEFQRGNYQTTVYAFGREYITVPNKDKITTTTDQSRPYIVEREEGFKPLGDILMEMIKFKNTLPIGDMEVDEDSLYSQICRPEEVATSSGKEPEPVVVVTTPHTTTSSALAEKPDTTKQVTTSPVTNIKQTGPETDTTIVVGVSPKKNGGSSPKNKELPISTVLRSDLLALKARLEGRS